MPTSFDWSNPVDAHKQFHILGWFSDGRPIIRFGILWLKFSKQSMRLVRAIQDLDVNEEKSLEFKTLAGGIPYTVRRVR